MVFDNSHNTDASRSTFNHVGGDQTNQHVKVVNFNFSLFGSKQATPHEQVNPDTSTVKLPVEASPQSSASSSSSTDSLMPSQPSTVAKTTHPPIPCPILIRSSIALIVQITGLLLGQGGHCRDSVDFQLELKTLHQALVLTNLALQEYGDRCLGPQLLKMVSPAIQNCHAVLQELLDKLNVTWKRLNFRKISSLWRQARWRQWYINELASSKAELSRIRGSLAQFLLTLNSTFTTLNLQNNSHRIDLSLQDFHAMLTQRAPLLGPIRLNSVQVVDHWGHSVSTPQVMSSSWKDFDYIVRCRYHVGNRAESDHSKVIQYELTGNRDLVPSRLIPKVRSDVQVEMDVLLRQKAPSPTTKTKCPRCHHLNLNSAAVNGWIECLKCLARFRVTKAQEPNPEHVTKLEEESAESRIEEIVSPLCKQTDNEATFDCPQLFRRVYILWSLNKPSWNLKRKQADPDLLMIKVCDGILEHSFSSSSSSSGQGRKGWYNSRGDRLLTNDGAYEPPPAGEEYPPDLEEYPEYGDGWMNEEGLMIDIQYRLVFGPFLVPKRSRGQRRSGWFNRRGDQLWRNDGAYMPAPTGEQYPPDLKEYPDPGEGWMNEEGLKIDMQHRVLCQRLVMPARSGRSP